MSTMRASSVIPLILTAVLLMPAPVFAACGGSTSAPQCDDACPAGQACVASGAVCGCQPTTLPCGALAGAPACSGSCPPSQPVCATLAAGCACIPAPASGE
jgi:hypothetical protein